MLGKEENFHCKSRKTTFEFLLPFYLTQKHQICILYQENFIKKSFIKELY